MTSNEAVIGVIDALDALAIPYMLDVHGTRGLLDEIRASIPPS